jgi:uncharacterized protein YgbK (DUF1537 family)
VEIVGFADDATGAMDVAGSLHSRGYPVRVTMEGATDLMPGMVEVTNLSSRYDSPVVSAEKLTAVLRESGVDNYDTHAFLKVDSTLRGNLASDLATLESSNGYRPLFVAPAFPFYGRTCVNGIYLVKGQPIHTTEFANDRKFQVNSPILGDHFPNASHIDWTILDGGVEAVLETLEQSANRTFTFDTRDQTDLEIIAEAGLAANASMIGSSGLARAFPRKEPSLSHPYKTLDLPSLFVIGSMHPMSRAQKQSLINVAGVETQVPLSDMANAQDAHSMRRLIAGHLEAGRTVCLTTPDTKIGDPHLQIQLENTLGDCANIHEIPHNLVIVGGETVRATLRARGIGSLLLKGEYEDGIPMAIETETAQEAIITKAGGFGHSNTLVNIHNFLRKV